MTNGRNKGVRGELELAHFLTDHGFPSIRGQQHKGGPGSPDVLVEGLEDVHLECKRCEQTRLEEWMAQAKKDAGDKVPVVAHRKNNGEWIAMLPLAELLRLFITRGF